MANNALIIGNSDGIGLAVTAELLKQGWMVVGISRSESSIQEPGYRHIKAQVQDKEYLTKLKSALGEDAPIDLCVYCAGVGEMLDPTNMDQEIEIIEVNLLGMVRTASQVIPNMVNRGKGHFLGLSSVADELLSSDAPSYTASKAGFSNYLEGLALALKPKGVAVSNVRFGFVDTKMAKADVKPFMMSVDRAVQHLLKCIEKKPIRYTAPWIMIPLVRLLSWKLRLQVLFT